MDLDQKEERLSPRSAGQFGIEAEEEVNLNTSTTSEEEEAAIEKRKEKLREEIKEVIILSFIRFSNSHYFLNLCQSTLFDRKPRGLGFN